MRNAHCTTRKNAVPITGKGLQVEPGVPCAPFLSSRTLPVPSCSFSCHPERSEDLPFLPGSPDSSRGLAFGRAVDGHSGAVTHLHRRWMCPDGLANALYAAGDWDNTGWGARYEADARPKALWPHIPFERWFSLPRAEGTVIWAKPNDGGVGSAGRGFLASLGMTEWRRGMTRGGFRHAPRCARGRAHSSKGHVPRIDTHSSRGCGSRVTRHVSPMARAP